MNKYKEYPIDEILAQLESLAPPELAEEWDHVGLMIGDGQGTTSQVVLALDGRMEAVQLCKKHNAKLLITHHPLLFSPLRRIRFGTPQGDIIREVIRNDISVYSAHTNLDKAQQGVNFALAKAVGLPMPMSIIGVNYGLCGDLKESEDLYSLLTRLKKILEGTGFFLNTDENPKITRIFVAGGAFDESSIPNLKKAHVDLVISGEIKHHQLLEMKALGMAAVAVGHDVSERVVLPHLEKWLNLQFPGLGVVLDSGLDYNKVVF